MADENRNGVVETDFGDGPHRFRLAMGQLEELQEKTGVGPFSLLQRFIAGDWSVVDVRETVRLGLVGGGMEPLAALNLVRRYVDEGNWWISHAALAKVIMLAALAGAPEELPGKDGAPGEKNGASNFRTDASPSAPSTEQPAQPE